LEAIRWSRWPPKAGESAVFKPLTLALAVLATAGCSSKLETGYEPRRLDMSLTQRRALYADPYSQEAAEAQHDQGDEHARQPSHTPGSY